MPYHGSTSSRSTSLATFSNDSLYITLQYQGDVNGPNEYHWGFYLTEKNAPKGYYIHATDADREYLQLKQVVSTVSNPLKSMSIVVVLYIRGPITLKTLKDHASSVPLMDSQWLLIMSLDGLLEYGLKKCLMSLIKPKLLRCHAASVSDNLKDNIEDNCRATANRYLPCLGKQPARVFENQTWVRPIPQKGIEQTAASETVTHYASAMDIDEPNYDSSRT
ncbi:hypothetical protein F5Y08DRAFT_340560 [Xylaria arbuscula]|nr:hypothetical protein F5Y08DRAFT_340560 [Xylaria arbuscula]